MPDEHFHSKVNHSVHNSFNCIWLLHVSLYGTGGPQRWWQRCISHIISCAMFLLLEAHKQYALQHFKSECLNKSTDQAKKAKKMKTCPHQSWRKKENTYPVFFIILDEFKGSLIATLMIVAQDMDMSNTIIPWF